MKDDLKLIVGPMKENRVQYNLRKLDMYCKEKKILPTQLTKKELKQFEIPPEKIPVNL